VAHVGRSTKPICLLITALLPHFGQFATNMSRSDINSSAAEFLARADARQNEVIGQLDELNAKIEAVISEWTQLTKHEAKSSL